MRTVAGHALDRVRRCPCKLTLATIVLCALVGDWYPFSAFPMYSVFAPQTSYVWVSDGDGRPVATTPTFGISTALLLRFHQARMFTLRKAGVPEAAVSSGAAVATLRFLTREGRPEQRGISLPPRLLLWRTTFRLKDGRAVGSQLRLGELATK